MISFTTEDYHGFEQRNFEYHGRSAAIAVPENVKEGRPWVWRAEFFGVFDTVDAELLRRGWHIVYYGISDMYGSPESVGLMRDFYDFITVEFGLDSKCDMFGFSRGGLYAFNYTCAYPDAVSTLYLDAPVLDMRDWPCGKGHEHEEGFLDAPRKYGMTKEAFLADRTLQPVDRMYELIDSKVPVIVVAGDADGVVDFRRNGRRLCDMLYSLGHDYMEIIKPGCDHHPHSLEDPIPVVEFIEKHRN